MRYTTINNRNMGGFLLLNMANHFERLFFV